MAAMWLTCKTVLSSVKSVASNKSYCELGLAMANHLSRYQREQIASLLEEGRNISQLWWFWSQMDDEPHAPYITQQKTKHQFPPWWHSYNLLVYSWQVFAATTSCTCYWLFPATLPLKSQYQGNSVTQRNLWLLRDGYITQWSSILCLRSWHDRAKMVLWWPFHLTSWLAI